MFVDACLPSDPAGSMRERLETLQRFGFAAVCWDTEITGRFDSRHRCSSRREVLRRGLLRRKLLSVASDP